MFSHGNISSNEVPKFVFKQTDGPAWLSLPRLSGTCRPGMQNTGRQWGWNEVEGTALSLPHHHQSVPAQRLSMWHSTVPEEEGIRSLESNLALLSTSAGVGQGGNTGGD